MINEIDQLIEATAVPPLHNINVHVPADEPVVIGIAGGSGSGKTTLVHAIIKALGSENLTVIPHDNYYKDLRHLTIEERAENNFDHPDSLDTPLLVEHIKLLKQRKPVKIPTYDFSSHTRKESLLDVVSSNVIIVEGILIFSDPALCELMDIKIFVETSDDIRLIRRITRDISERGRTFESVVQQYLKTVRPMHHKFVEPSKHNADIIVPAEGDNAVALDILVCRLKKFLEDK
jgi:uridine kinase